jgi:hypothetical protein
MKNKSESLLSRREFARRAAVLSATVPCAYAAAIVPKASSTAAESEQQASPTLSVGGQTEVDARYQQILSLYGSRLDEEQKTRIKRLCTELQPVLERVRNFKLQNGDAPALYLKPLVEREKKLQPTAKPSRKAS